MAKTLRMMSVQAWSQLYSLVLVAEERWEMFQWGAAIMRDRAAALHHAGVWNPEGKLEFVEREDGFDILGSECRRCSGEMDRWRLRFGCGG